MAKRLIVVSILLGACSASQPGPGGTEGFVVQRMDSDVIDATLTSGGSSLHLLVAETDSSIVDVTFDFGDSVIAFRLDYNQGIGDFMPSGSPLDASHARLIDQMLVELSQRLTMTAAERSLVQDVAFRQTSFMQIVPQGELLTAFTFKSERGWTYISCSCYNQYIGSGYYRTAGRGCGCGPGGCKGRCGAGCDPWNSGSSAYTQDCAKHDYGLGSWTAASDDFSFARNNCSAVHC